MELDPLFFVMISFFKLADNRHSELMSEFYSDEYKFFEENCDLDDEKEDDFIQELEESKSFDRILSEQRFDREAYNQAYVQTLVSLLDSNAEFDANEREIDNRDTILMAITKTGRLDLVQTLVEAGANPNTLNREGSFALKYAALYGWQEIFRYLAPITSSELQPIAEPLLNSGILERQKREDGYYQKVQAFTTAAFYGNEGAVSTALSRGVDINAIDSSNETALLKATRNQKDSMVQLLLKAGADPNIGPNIGIPLSIALKEGNDSIFQMLLAAGANINGYSIYGETVLMSAVVVSNAAAVKQLLQMGADTSPKNNEGTTALDIANMLAEKFPEDIDAQKIFQLLVPINSRH